MDQTQDDTADAGKDGGFLSLSSSARLIVTSLATAVLLILFDLVDGRLYYRDIDDVLRGIQIRQLLDHGQWYDLVLRGIDMPGAYLSPWSRLVGLPYVAISLALKPLLGEEAAVQWAFLLWQPVLLVAFCGLWIATAVRIAGPAVKVEPVHVVAAVALMPLTIWEFVPGRIDHHNVQILFLMLGLCGVSCWSLRGGLWTGLAIALSVIVGLELAPILVVLLLGCCLAFVWGVRGGRRMLTGLSVALLVVPLVGGFAFLGIERMLATECDAFSAPYIAALTGFAVLTLPAALFLGPARRLPRLLCLAAGGALLLAGLAHAFPSCLAGPYAFIDPQVRALWMDRIQQEMSFLDFYRASEMIKVVLLGLLAIVLVGALPALRDRLRRADAPFCIVLATGAALLVLTLLQTRFIRFPAAAVLLVLPIVWTQVRERIGATAKVTAAASVVIAGICLALWVVVSRHPQRLELLDYMTVDLCTDVDAAPLRNLAPGRIVAPTSLALFMLDRLPDGLTINAISFHRAAPGMRRMFDVFLSTDGMTRKAAAAPFDYLAICRYDMVPTIPNDTLFAALTRGGSWPGLSLLHDGPPGTYRLFKIDHAKFE